MALAVGLRAGGARPVDDGQGQGDRREEQADAGRRDHHRIARRLDRKLTTKTDKKGEFIQLLTESGMYRITATDPKIGTASNDTRGRARQGVGDDDRAGADDGRQRRRQGRGAEEGVRRRRRREPRRQSRRGDREVQRGARDVAGLLRLPVQHRRRLHGEEGREGRPKKRGRRRSR